MWGPVGGADHELVRLGVKVESVVDLTDRGVRRELSITRTTLTSDDKESLEGYASAGQIELDHDFDREPV